MTLISSHPQLGTASKIDGPYDSGCIIRNRRHSRKASLIANSAITGDDLTALGNQVVDATPSHT